MSYFFETTITGTMEETKAKVIDALKKEGFGILTEIDVQETIKKKLSEDFRPYLILGACNPPFAYDSLLAEPNIGLMLPCNVVIQEKEPGTINVSAIDPASAMGEIDNSSLMETASRVRERLHKVINSL